MRSNLIRKICTHFIFLISFFISLFFTECSSPQKPEPVSIQWINGKATGLVIHRTLLQDAVRPETDLKIQLVKPGERTDMLGQFRMEHDYIIFEPVVPFTNGLRYELLLNDVILSEIEIPASKSDAPELIAVYPTQDTVPENLLKMYFHFSQPMAEGHSLTHVTVINRKDTLSRTFLDLQPELWNTGGTVLTLWLDPGRIKRDLIPNQELGTPLKSGEKYILQVSVNWKSAEGIPLLTSYTKTFVAAARDEQIPSTYNWSVKAPPSGTTQALKIDLKESLDYSLLMEAIRIVDAAKDPVQGTIQLMDEERTLLFTPETIWKAGQYMVLAEPRLEDLAGNNLNRPFDRDVMQSKKENQNGFGKAFTIR